MGSVSAMDIVQLVALAVGILALVWHQQRSVAALRAEMKQEIGALRAEMREEIAGLRAEIAALRDAVHANSQRLSRIEGYFGFDMPAEAAAMAPGARFADARTETAPAGAPTGSGAMSSG